MSSAIKLEDLSDKALWDLYGRVKLNIMLAQIFDPDKIPKHIPAFAKAISREITDRGLDKNTDHKGVGDRA